MDGSGAAAWTGVSAPSLAFEKRTTKLAPVVRESETGSVLLSACKEMTTAGSATGAEMTPAYIPIAVGLLEEGRRVAARSVNAALTTTYWLVGRRLVERDQGGDARAT